MSTREYGDEEELGAPTDCPDCSTGKHLACIGSSWDPVTDHPAICACWADNHRSPLVP